jgi:hypothetical protein
LIEVDAHQPALTIQTHCRSIDSRLPRWLPKELRVSQLAAQGRQAAALLAMPAPRVEKVSSRRRDGQQGIWKRSFTNNLAAGRRNSWLRSWQHGWLRSWRRLPANEKFKTLTHSCD